MFKATPDPLAYYASQSFITEPQTFVRLFEDLPTKVPALCHVIQGIMLHPYEAHLYGVELPEKRWHELDIRNVAPMLSHIYELDVHSLTIERSPDSRLVGNCRDFATMLCAMLRHQGVPARVRNGFATYFESEFYTDHVVCEYWNDEEQRWILVDAQVDDTQRQAYRIKVDTCDVSHSEFLLAGKAWQIYRTGRTDPNRFGISSSGPRGISFIQSGLVRDLAALNKLELLCQDMWGLAEVKDQDGLSEDELSLLDRVATITLADNSSFAELCLMFENDVRLCGSSVIKCYTQVGIRMVDLTADEKPL